MNERNEREPAAQDKGLRLWLTRAVWGLGGITLAGLTIAAVLLVRIYQISGWNAPWAQSGEKSGIYTQAQIDKFITSVLVTVQNQPLSQAGAEADLVFIASFNAFEQRLTMVALAKDTLMEVEGYGQKTLGEAYVLGGPSLLVNTINQNFGLDLQSYVCTDTHSLGAMIDLLGGIQTELTAGEAGYINDALGERLSAGPVTLTGVQSMVHAMDGLSDGEPMGSLGRSLDLVHSALFSMRATATKEAMLPLLSLVFSNIKTNLDFTTLHDLGYEILKAEDIDYHSLILPAADTFKAEGTPIQADIPSNAALLRETLYNAG